MEHLKTDFHLQLSVLDFGFNTSASLSNTSVLFCPDRLAPCLQTYQLGKHGVLCVQLKGQLFTSQKPMVRFLLLTCRHLKSQTVISIYTCLEKKAF